MTGIALHAGTGAGAFLLFALEPHVAKAILPWFGGGAGVWATCLVFFQATLLAGYGYAHLASRLTARRGALVHLALLVASLASLPVAPNERWIDLGASAPELAILGLLAEAIGLPFLLLAATSPLLQTWSTRLRPATSPFPLYASSNLGSMLALVAYPFLLEPSLGLRAQSRLWSLGFAAHAALVAAISLAATGAEPVAGARGASGPSSHRLRALWFALAAVPSALLLAVTNRLCLDVAPTPFLWLLPLAIYLATFVATFAGERTTARRVWFLLLVPAFAGVARAELHPLSLPLAATVAIYGGVLLVACMLCHGELARLRPPPERLTSFYGWIAFGGAIGSAFVAFVAPRLFASFAELPLSLLAVPPLVLVAASEPGIGGAAGLPPAARRLAAAFAGALAGAALVPLVLAPGESGPVVAKRNFYGVLRVVDENRDGRTIRTLLHGVTTHGVEILGRPDRPTSYYGERSGLAIALARHRSAAGPRRIGVVGLGAGTIAAYGRRGDVIRFYEIDPLVAEIARSSFRFLAASPAAIDVVVGDGRLALAREPSQRFDVLVADAFSSDAIPLHLLTVEAFAVYRRHLVADGLLAVHVSNRYVDVEPFVAAAGASVGLEAIAIDAPGDRRTAASRSHWILLADAPAFFADPLVSASSRAARPAAAAWTDDAASLFSALRGAEALPLTESGDRRAGRR